MRVEIRKVDSYEEEIAQISAASISEDLQSAIDILENHSRAIPVQHEGETLLCPISRIYYIESVDKRTYVYTKDGCYVTKYRLYELDDLLGLHFFRASKAMIVNLRKIRSVKAEINGRMVAQLLNGEKVIIARSCVKELKKRLGIV